MGNINLQEKATSIKLSLITYKEILKQVVSGDLLICTRVLENRVTNFLDELNTEIQRENSAQIKTRELYEILNCIELNQEKNIENLNDYKQYLAAYTASYRGRRLIDHEASSQLLDETIAYFETVTFEKKQKILDDLRFLKILNDNEVAEVNSCEMDEIYRNNKNHIGIANFYSRLIAQECIVTGTISDNLKLAKQINERVLNDEGEYAKFVATKGLIYHALHEYDIAITCFKKAISLEDSYSEQYMVKLNTYTKYEIAARIDQANDVFKNVEFKIDNLESNTVAKLQSVDEKLEENTRSTMEIISLFIAIISVILGGTTIASNLSAESMPAALIIFGMIALVTITLFSWLKLSHYSSKNEQETWKLKFYICGLTVCTLILVVIMFVSIDRLNDNNPELQGQNLAIESEPTND